MDDKYDFVMAHVFSFWLTALCHAFAVGQGWKAGDYGTVFHGKSRKTAGLQE